MYGMDQFHVTRDAGRLWSTISPDVYFGDRVGGVEFVNPATGWVIVSDSAGHNKLYMTSDGGRSWALLTQ